MKETYQDILSMAIRDEVEAFEFYDSVAHKVFDRSLKQIFSELAGEEQKHRQLLQAFLENPAIPLRFKENIDYKVSESVALPQLSMEMKPADAIALAMKKEEEAMKAYQEFSRVSSDPDQSQAFSELAAMEQGHKTKLEKLYTNMAFPEIW
ncbi:MAG TPA: ferritin family protein [Syntrophomonadaceae bacterium]|nr:ferritin family protein [Syntrophomonadaceae bacterium]